jgi:simple sugar transport system substrate-binding protein
VAEKAGVKAFGQASDQAAFCPNAHMTAIIDDWDSYYVARAAAVADGTWESQDTWWGLDEGMVKMAKYQNMSPETKYEAIKLQNDLTSGAVHSFEGPIYNQLGELVVPAGAVADDGMLAGMSFYVQGINDELPQ